MAVTTRGRQAGVDTRDLAALRAEVSQLREEVAQLRSDRRLLARGMAALQVATAPGSAPATYAQIVTVLSPVYSHAEAARVEQIINGG